MSQARAPSLSQAQGAEVVTQKAYSSATLFVPSQLRHHIQVPRTCEAQLMAGICAVYQPSTQPTAPLPARISISEGAAIGCVLWAPGPGAGLIFRHALLSPHPCPAFPYCCVFPIGAIHPRVGNTHTREGCGGESALCQRVKDAFLDLSGNIFYLVRKNAGPNSSLL